MKVKRKNVYVREDCFKAEEKGVLVWIETYRHKVFVRVIQRENNTENDMELTLEQLAKQLLK